MVPALRLLPGRVQAAQDNVVVRRLELLAVGEAPLPERQSWYPLGDQAVPGERAGDLVVGEDAQHEDRQPEGARTPDDPQEPVEGAGPDVPDASGADDHAGVADAGG